jgi:hypothetical protein
VARSSLAVLAQEFNAFRCPRGRREATALQVCKEFGLERAGGNGTELLLQEGERFPLRGTLVGGCQTLELLADIKGHVLQIERRHLFAAFTG